MNRGAEAASKGLMHVALIGVVLSVSGWMARAEVSPEAKVETAARPVAALYDHESLYGGRVLDPGHLLYALESSAQFIGHFQLSLSGSIGVGLGGGFDLRGSLEASMPPGQHGGYEAATLSVRKHISLGLDERFFPALQLDAVGARFESPEAAENLIDARHMTGYRDLNLGLAMPITWGQGLHGYVKPEVFVTLDLRPAPSGPLTGAPPPYTLGANFALEVGDDMRFGGGFPLRMHTAVRLVVHGRPDDKTVTFTTILGFGFG